MVYKTHLDYHMATPNLPEIKSYVDSANAQRIVSQCPSSSGAYDACPFMPDDISSFSTPFSANDHVQSRFVPQTDSKPGFSWKTIVLCLSFFAAVAFLGYNQYSYIQSSTNYAGYEIRGVMDRLKIHLADAIAWCEHMLTKIT